MGAQQARAARDAGVGRAFREDVMDYQIRQAMPEDAERLSTIAHAAQASIQASG